MTAFRSKPENVAIDPDGMAPLRDGWEYTAIPLLDTSEKLSDGATPICAQLTYADCAAACARLGLVMLDPADLEYLHAEAVAGRCIELPAFLGTPTAETSLEHRRISDEANRKAMLARGWKPGARVCNFGKGWVAGAPAGRAHLMGWWVPNVDPYSSSRTGPDFIQDTPPPGSQGAHDAYGHADDGTNGWGKRKVVYDAAGAAPGTAVINPPSLLGAAPLPMALFRQARHFHAGRKEGRPIWIVIHTAETLESGTSAEGLQSYAATMPDGRQASWHYAVDNNSIAPSVREEHTAWAAPGANARGIQVELACRAAQTAADWADAYSTAQLDLAARLVAEICERWQLPVVKVGPKEMQAGRPGICGHHDVTLGIGKGRTNHTDPGKAFPWEAFLASVAKHIGRVA